MDTEKGQENAAGGESRNDEIGGLKRENERLDEEVKSRDAAILRLEQAAAARVAEIAALKKSLDEAGQKIESLEKSLAGAVAAYREMVAEENPGPVAELITGQTIEAVGESLRKARALVARVRQEMEEAAARTRVPAGAPQRTPPDFGELSTREKIQYGIGGG